MSLFLKWFFSNHGVIATDVRPIVLFRIGQYGIAITRRPFRSYRPEGPTMEEYKYHCMILKRTVVEHKCQGCGCRFWGYKQGKHCGSWPCFKKAYGGKK